MIKIIPILSSVLLIFQVIPNSDVFTNVDKLTLTGALILAIGILWRQIQKKDDKLEEKDSYIYKILEATTKALETNADSLTQVVRAKEELKDSIDKLRIALITTNKIMGDGK